ncbi:hypothetical protein [Burkholderia cepacia]|uniref:hypothetical protein n=1 Tax=Burkholderia cepacia TaxID=292 RepID=UPI001F1C4989|nr:hypothetical protein [Burkholderia cepacia]MCE4124413.1 hypothetical protein [Burkholderia cepacia]
MLFDRKGCVDFFGAGETASDGTLGLSWLESMLDHLSIIATSKVAQHDSARVDGRRRSDKANIDTRSLV